MSVELSSMHPAQPLQSGVVFVIDRVMHYHVATMRAIEAGLAVHGISFTLLSAQDAPNAVGRVAYRESVVRRHDHFRLTERPVGRFMFRMQHDLVRILAPAKPSVIISTCHSGTLSEWHLLYWARSRGVRRVAWQCGFEYNPSVLKRFLLRRFVSLFNFHLCYHTNARAYALRYGARPDSALVMHNTIDESRIVHGDRDVVRAGLVAKWPQLADKKIVLYVGAVLEEKRLDLVFDALSLIDDPKLCFVIVGDGPHLDVIMERYQGRVDWISAGRVVEGVGNFFDAADVFVLPGTGGLAINEAMAHALPVISGYADGSADDLVVDGETGLRLTESTAIAWAAGIRLLVADPEKSRAMGLKGQLRIRGQLSFKLFIARVVDSLVMLHRQATES